MIGLGVWQNLLQALGWVLARLYDLIPSYAVSIILLTVFIRLLLLPLGIKQVRSMHAMTRLQPKVKAIQTKYKGNRPRQQEEIQKLYQEHGVSPLGGCLPMVLQIPVLIALYSVLRFPANVGAYPIDQPAPFPSSHIPVESTLYSKIINPGGEVRWLLCSAGQAGTKATLAKPGQELVVAAPTPTENHVKNQAGDPVVKVAPLDCGAGGGIPVRIPYYALALVMVFTTYYQSRQMQRVNPSGSQQQQTLTRVMPLLFGVWGFLFPAGLVVYWTTSNLWQIGQQHFVLRAREREELAIAEGRKAPPEPKRRGGLMSGMMQRAQQERDKRGPNGAGGGGKAAAAGKSASGSKTGSGSKSGAGTGSGKSSGSKPSSGPNKPPAPDPDRPRSYKPAATGGDGRGKTAPRGTRSPYGVAAEDGTVNTGGSSGGSGSASGTPNSGKSNQSPSSGSRTNAGNRRKRRKR